VQYDTDRLNGKGMAKSVSLINETIAPKISGYKCKNQMEIDKLLENLFEQLGGNSLYCVNNVSFGIPKIQAHVLCKPLFNVIQELA
jgi:enolase